MTIGGVRFTAHELLAVTLGALILLPALVAGLALIVATAP